MTRSIAARLALKDLYMTRWPVVGSLAAGLLSIAIAPLGQTAFYVGSVGLICVLVVLNIFTVMSGVLQEKKDNVLVFLLSLPISTTRYWLVKMATNVAIFGGSWLLLTLVAVLTIQFTALPNGVIPFFVATSVYILTYYCVLLAIAVASDSLAWTTGVIVAGNISINFFIPLVFRLPSAAHTRGEEAVWGGDVIATIAVALAVGAAAIAAAAVVQSRKRDFV
jgi:hypothetical protein